MDQIHSPLSIPTHKIPTTAEGRVEEWWIAKLEQSDQTHLSGDPDNPKTHAWKARLHNVTFDELTAAGIPFRCQGQNVFILAEKFLYFPKDKKWRVRGRTGKSYRTKGIPQLAELLRRDGLI